MLRGIDFIIQTVWSHYWSFRTILQKLTIVTEDKSL